MNLETLNYLTALATLALQITGIAFLALFFLRKKFPDLAPIALFLETNGLWIGLLTTLGSVILSLYYSEILGVAPCGLCWLQRVFLYPQAVLFALAVWKKDRGVAVYSIALSIFGAVVALYQHYLQMGGASVLPCPAVAGGAVNCAQRFLFELGYITFPLMSFTLFAFLIVLMLFVRKARIA
ncbi:MAG: disulfide bond formation protein B [bacterium]|nr:disulfide bond formation protein B [bacterium]